MYQGLNYSSIRHLLLISSVYPSYLRSWLEHVTVTWQVHLLLVIVCTHHTWACDSHLASALMRSCCQSSDQSPVTGMDASLSSQWAVARERKLPSEASISLQTLSPYHCSPEWKQASYGYLGALESSDRAKARFTARINLLRYHGSLVSTCNQTLTCLKHIIIASTHYKLPLPTNCVDPLCVSVTG